MKTLMQCDRERCVIDTGGTSTQVTSRVRVCVCDAGVVVEGVQRCADWFSNKWAECMEMIPVPVINHILCVPMKFHFLCDVMRGETYTHPHHLICK